MFLNHEEMTRINLFGPTKERMGKRIDTYQLVSKMIFVETSSGKHCLKISEIDRLCNTHGGERHVESLIQHNSNIVASWFVLKFHLASLHGLGKRGVMTITGECRSLAFLCCDYSLSFLCVLLSSGALSNLFVSRCHCAIVSHSNTLWFFVFRNLLLIFLSWRNQCKWLLFVRNL
jgi:hypothetical protein